LSSALVAFAAAQRVAVYRSNSEPRVGLRECPRPTDLGGFLLIRYRAAGREKRTNPANLLSQSAKCLKSHQVVAEVLVRVVRARQPSPLQCWYQAVADLQDVATREVAVEQQEPVAAYLLHHLRH